MSEANNKAIVLLFFVTGLFRTHRLLQDITKYINDKISSCLTVAVRFTAAVLRILKYNIKPLLSWTVHNQKHFRTKTVQPSFHVGNRRKIASLKSQKFTLSKATTYNTSLSFVTPPSKMHQTMNAFTPSKSYEVNTRSGLLSVSRSPPSLPPSCSLPSLPSPPPSSAAILRCRNRTSSSPFFHSSSASSTRRRPQQYHPLTQNTRLQPLTPIYSTTTSDSPMLQALLPELCVETSELQEQTRIKKEIPSTKEEEEDEEQLELDWRSMLEMFPRPRTYSQTAKYLAKQRMGMMGSAA